VKIPVIDHFIDWMGVRNEPVRHKKLAIAIFGFMTFGSFTLICYSTYYRFVVGFSPQDLLLCAGWFTVLMMTRMTQILTKLKEA
jgi:hypothetical protein